MDRITLVRHTAEPLGLLMNWADHAARINSGFLNVSRNSNHGRVESRRFGSPFPVAAADNRRLRKPPLQG